MVDRIGEQTDKKNGLKVAPVEGEKEDHPLLEDDSNGKDTIPSYM